MRRRKNFVRSSILGLCLALSGCIPGICDDKTVLWVQLGFIVVALVGVIIIRND